MIWVSRRAVFASLLLLCIFTFGSAVLIPRQRALWPSAPELSPEPLPVDVVRSAKARDSVIFAGVVAFSAAVRLITAEMPLYRGATLNLVAFGVTASAPTVLASVLALVIKSERRFSWV